MIRLNLKNEVQDYFFITFGLLLYAFGWTAFLLPYEISSGGLTGVSALIYYVTGLEMQNTYLVMNALLLVAAVKVLGIKFCVKTIYAVLALTFFLWAMQRLLISAAGDGATTLPRFLGEDQDFMATIIGSSLCGMGLAQCFLHQGSTGGVDIIAAMVNKYKNISLGRMLLYLDIIIVSSCYFVFHDWRRVVFGFVEMFVCNMVLDYVMNYVQQSVQFFIITKHPDDISKGIIEEMDRSATLLPGTGCYSGQPVSILMVVAKKNQSVALYRLVKTIDPSAFISQTKCQGVYGEGFDRLK
ncbi:MAG: YitT family protein [Prevotellaceae bacterium]|nr:YitT family protein [Candidatus Minthosoma caballi]